MEDAAPFATLKPSLVEWKLNAPARTINSMIHLETFLGGMETLDLILLRGVEPPPLKPSLVEWKPGLFGDMWDNPKTLETFLGGMETMQVRGFGLAVCPLKPSLVEWKLKGSG